MTTTNDLYRLDRIQLWATGYRELMQGGLGDTIHTAATRSTEMPNGLHANLDIEDVEWLIQMADALIDLKPRCERAAVNCDELAQPEREDGLRLTGKASGLRIALSYIDEAIRGLS
jgi:hypothetical protein